MEENINLENIVDLLDNTIMPVSPVTETNAIDYVSKLIVEVAEKTETIQNMTETIEDLEENL